MQIAKLVFTCALLLSFTGAVLAQQADKMTTGISVSGYWKIEVFNPDGSLDQEIEFQNALIGHSVFTSLLNGDIVTGGTYIVIGVNGGGSGPCNNGTCEIAPSGLDIGVTPNSTDFTSELFTSTQSFDGYRLKGNVTVTSAATINMVQTWITSCGNKTNAGCRTSADVSSVLTSKTLASGVAVTVGQIVQITVEIVFS